MEEWRKIDPPFDNYSVSDLGRVRNDETQYIYKSSINRKYPEVSLKSSLDQKMHSKLTHVLAAQQFLGYTEEMQKDKKVVVHHIDSDKKNARIANLQITTAKANALHGVSNRVQKKANRSQRPVLQFEAGGPFVAEYASVKDIPFGNHTYIYDTLRGKQPTAYGFFWEYKEEIVPDEEWKSITINGSKLKASNKGRIETEAGYRTNGTLVDGYMRMTVNLKSFYVHRIVAMAFKPIDNCEGMVVNHIDENKQNNCIDNLEWLSPKENTKAYFKTPRIKDMEWCKKRVIQILPNGELIEHPSLTEAAQALGAKHCTGIIAVCNNRQKTAHGFKWKYYDPTEKKGNVNAEQNSGDYSKKQPDLSRQ